MIISLVERYSPTIHGRTEHTSPGIEGRFLALEMYNPIDFAADPSLANSHLATLRQARTKGSDTSLELVSIERLQGGEDVAVIRTSAIARFQSVWRARVQFTL
jgi:hypothetical protein